MAEGAPGRSGVTPADLPGRTTVADRVIAKLAQHAASRTSPSVRGTLPGTGLPATDVTVSGTRAHVTARIAGRWPVAASVTATAVAEAISSDLTRFGGLTVDRVEVTVTDFVLDAAEHERKVQ